MQTHQIDVSSQFSLAVNAGRIHGAKFDRIKELLDADARRRAEMKAQAIEGLTRAAMISAADGQILASLTDTVITRDKPVQNSLSEARDIARKLRDVKASPHALIVAAIAVDSLEKVVAHPGPQPRGDVAHADVEGALVGGILGLELAGPVGCAAGMLCGGAAASIAQAI